MADTPKQVEVTIGDSGGKLMLDFSPQKLEQVVGKAFADELMARGPIDLKIGGDGPNALNVRLFTKKVAVSRAPSLPAAENLSAPPVATR